MKFAALALAAALFTVGFTSCQSPTPPPPPPVDMGYNAGK